MVESTLRECDATQQIHVRSHNQGSVGESVFPSRRVNASTTRQIQVSIHQGCCSETGGYGIQKAFTITGLDQAQRQSGTGRLKNGAFKEEFASFLMIEWKKDHYGPVVGNKTIYISHGGKMHDDAEQQRT